MEKTGKIAALFIAVGLLLCGCRASAAGQPAQPLRVVTQVDVTCRQDEDIWQRHYTQPEKAQAVLSYLRLLKYRGTETPEETDGLLFEIQVLFSNGSQKAFFQQGDSHLRRDGGPWEKIDPEQGCKLLPLLERLPSDL